MREANTVTIDSCAKNGEAGHCRQSPPIAQYKIFAAIFSVLYLGIYAVNVLMLTNKEAVTAVDIAGHVAIPLAILLTLYFSHRQTFWAMAAELKWSSLGVLCSLLLGLLLAHLFSDVIYKLMSLVPHIPFPLAGKENFTAYFIQREGWIGVWFMAITAGVFEEFLYKTVLIRAFKNPPSQGTFAAVSSILFGVSHFMGQGLIPVVIYTIMFGYPTAVYYYQERKILNLIVIHMTIDLMLMGWFCMQINT